MNSWLLSICSVVFITSICTLILPEGKTGKYIKSIFAFITVFVVVSPLIDISKNSFSYQNFNNEIEIQQSYIDYVFNKKNSYNKELVNKILDEYSIKANVEILFFDNDNIYSVKKIYIKIADDVIFSDKEHIDIIEEIKDKISKNLNVEKSIINIEYERK